MADPYANQYPPPAPLVQPHQPYSPSFSPHQPPPQPQRSPYEVSTHYSQSTTTPQEVPLQEHPVGGYNDPQVPLPEHHPGGGYNSPQVPLQEHSAGGYNSPQVHVQEHSAGGYDDPQAISLSDYVQAEREEQQLQQQQYYHQQPQPPPQSYGYSDYHPPSQPQQTYYNQQYYDEEPEYPSSPKTPIVAATAPARPTLAPLNEAESYKPKTYPRHHDDRGCCDSCCCYNPAMTCCSCYCMLISLAFLAAGIALIIAAQVISNNCVNKCGELPDQLQGAQSSCDTICDKVVHDGMLYSGIGVTALAGIAVIWRLMMWICAGCSR